MVTLHVANIEYQRYELLYLACVLIIVGVLVPALAVVLLVLVVPAPAVPNVSAYSDR